MSEVTPGLLSVLKINRGDTLPKIDQTFQHMREVYKYTPRHWDEYKNSPISERPTESKEGAQASQKPPGRLTGKIDQQQYRELKDNLARVAARLEQVQGSVNNDWRGQ